MMQQYYTCPVCGSEIAVGSRFCSGCNTELDWSFLEEAGEPYENQNMSSKRQGEQAPSHEQSRGQSIKGGLKQLKRINIRTMPPNRKKQLAYILLAILGVVVLTMLAVIGILGGFESRGAPQNGSVVPAQNGNTGDSGTQLPDLPVIKSFVIAPLEMLKGDTANLSWEVSGADNVTIDQGIGEVATSGKKNVAPSQSTTYILTATNADGSVTKSARVIVNPKGMPVISSFTATPGEIESGESVTLSWSVSDAAKINILGIGDVAATGTYEVSPTSTTTYTLSATNSNGISKAYATVTMKASGIPVILSFIASSEAIYEGQSVTLEWYVTGADSVTIDHAVGDVSPMGSQDVSPTQTTTYTLTATNGAGSTIQSIEIQVTQSNMPLIIEFRPDPVNIVTGNSSTLNWNVINATSASIDGILITLPTGSKVVNPTVSTPYTLTATSNNGTAEKTIHVFVITKPIINIFTADDESIVNGESTFLRWNITGADSVSINQGIGDISGFTQSYEVSPTITTTYTLTATNTAGSTTATVTVEVD